MADKQSTALVERQAPIQAMAARDEAIRAFANQAIRDPLQYAEILREWHARAFIIGSEALMALPDGIVVIPTPVVVDTSFDPGSGRGAHVYHQYSIHKRAKDDRGEWTAVEVSLNATALKKMIEAAGVSLNRMRWVEELMTTIDEAGRKRRLRYTFAAEASGDVLSVDGTRRNIPPAIGSVDAEDGSAEIGEWTPEGWANAVAMSVEAAKDKKSEREKKDASQEILSKAFEGWTAARVRRYRQFGRQIAETKALNRLAYNLGIQHSYKIDDLKKKPFIIMRAVYQYDMNDPVVKRMVTASRLNIITPLLWPGAQSVESGSETHASAQIGSTFEGETVTAVVPDVADVETAPMPEDIEPLELETPSPDLYVIESVGQRKKPGGGVEYLAKATRGGKAVTLYTQDRALILACRDAAKDQRPREIATEAVGAEGQTYLEIIEFVGGQAALKL